MILLDLFSGYGGFHKGLEQAGFKFDKTYFSEVDKHAIANYRYNFKDAEYVGSVTDVDGTKLKQPHITTFGFPCQDLSLAGKRLGLKGKRSSLFYHAMRVCRESNTNILIWENVAGLLSSNNGNDLNAVLEEMYLSGFVFDINEQNTSWYLPQNRLRLYCIGYNVEYLWQILSKPSGNQQRLDICVKIMEGYLAHKFQNTLTDHLSQLPIKQHELVLGHVKDQSQKEFSGLNRKSKFLEIMSLLDWKDLKKCFLDTLDQQLKQNATNSDWFKNQSIGLIMGGIKLKDTEIKGKEELILNIELLLKKTSEENLVNLSMFIISILSKRTTPLKTYSYAVMQAIIELFILVSTNLYPNLWSKALLSLIEKEKYTRYAQNTNPKSGNSKENDNDAIQLSIASAVENDTFGHSATSERGFRQVFSIGENGGKFIKPPPETPGERQRVWGYNSQANCISSRYYKDGSENLISVQPVILQSVDKQGVMITSATKDGYEIANEGDSINFSVPNSNTRRGHVGKGKAQTLDTAANQATIQNSKIRRFTEIECERLQGLPDNWTKWGMYEDKHGNLVKKEISSTQRYKLCGNGVTATVVQVIGERLLK